MNLQDKTIEILLENKHLKKEVSDLFRDEKSLTDIEYEVMNIMKKFNRFKLSQYGKDYLCYWYNHISLDFNHFDSVNNTVECSLCLNPYVNSWINPKGEYPSYEDRKVRKYFNKNKEFINYCNNIFKDCFKKGLAWDGCHSSLWFGNHGDNELIKLDNLENFLNQLNNDIDEFLKVDLDIFWSKRKNNNF